VIGANVPLDQSFRYLPRLGFAACLALVVELFVDNTKNVDRWRPRGSWWRTATQERDFLIRTIAFEASGETEEGKVAVAYVILNRKRSGRWGDSIKSGRWGDSIKDVVTYPWQFEPWMTRRSGGTLPSWARGEGQPIGRHTFYSPDEGDGAPQRAAPSLSIAATPLSCWRPKVAEKLRRSHVDDKHSPPDLQTCLRATSAARC